MLQGEHSAILLTFIKLPFVIKIFVLSIFEWSLKTGFCCRFNPAFLWFLAGLCEVEGELLQSLSFLLKFLNEVFTECY